jgi:hypothetical protein
VGDDLARLDQRSEGLLNLINETNKIERKKLENAIVGLFDSEPQTEDSTYRAQFADIKIRIRERKDKIISSHGTCEETDEVLMALRRMSVDQRSTRDTCRLYCLLAATARSKRLYRIAIDRINEWFLEARGTYDRVGALHGRAVTHYSFGYSVDAVMVGERALMEYARDTRSGGSEEKRDQGLLRLMARVRSNLAYFYADLVSSWSGPRLDRTGGIA